jgi:3-hydroxypropanoate dehydrogenase
MSETINDPALDQVFRTARTYNSWSDQPIPDSLLEQVWDLAALAPTSANCSPARIVFVKTPDAKARLKPCLADGNVEKTMSAPCTAVIGHDMKFFDKLPELFPHTDARAWFVGNEDLIRTTAFRNGTLQGAYLMLAARAVGLDCGPMSGFDNEAVDAAFFAGTTIKSNFICNLGYGTDEGLHPRAPRLAFADACQIA